MKIRHLSQAFLILTLLLLVFLPRYPVRAADQLIFPDTLVVDFTSDESRSISVRSGSADGITTEMDFAVIDSNGRQIAEFFPHEILKDRFWSGPLARDSFKRIRVGDTVIRIELDEVGSSELRQQFKERLDLLAEEKRLERLRYLAQRRSELEESINEVDVAAFHLGSELTSLREKLGAEEDLARRRDKGLQNRIGDLREERSELSLDREALIERRSKLSTRTDPPPASMKNLNEEIRYLDREIRSLNIEIGDLRHKIRQNQEGAREIREEISRIREERQAQDADRRQLEKELNAVLGAMERLKKDAAP